VQINPANDGVRLRRRINQMAYHQESEVYVNANRRWTQMNIDFKRFARNSGLTQWVSLPINTTLLLSAYICVDLRFYFSL